MKPLVKIGGTLVDDAATRNALAARIDSIDHPDNPIRFRAEREQQCRYECRAQSTRGNRKHRRSIVKRHFKVAGPLVDSAAIGNALAAQIAATDHADNPTCFFAERGVNSRFLNGLRTADDAAMNAVVKVFEGRL